MNMSELLLTVAWQASRVREQEDLIASMRDQLGELKQRAADAEQRALTAERRLPPTEAPSGANPQIPGETAAGSEQAGAP